MEFIKKFQCQHCHGIVETEFADDYVICGHCESACQVPKEFGPGVVIDDFVIAKLLGEGGMGHVYLAHQFTLDRKVALKILKGDFLKDPKFKDEFIYEARSVACLNHPHIIQAYKVGEEHGIVFFAMEYVEGRNLQDILKEDGAITEKLALSVAMEIVSALGYAWDLRKLVHRDIKPENIMISNDGSAKLMDLGLSLRDGDDKDDGDTISGTPQYISPEQIVGSEMDIRGDFYCLGATLYHLVSGKQPFEGSLAEMIKQHLSAKPKPLNKVAPHLNTCFVKIIHKMMSKKPEDRYENAKTLLNAFQKDMQLILDEEQGKKHFKVTTQTNIKTSTNSSERIQRKKKMDPLIIASLAMLGLLLGGFFIIRLFMSSESSIPAKQVAQEIAKRANNSGGHVALQQQVGYADGSISEEGLFYSFYHIEMDTNRKITSESLIKIGHAKGFSVKPPTGRKDYYKLQYDGYITLPHSETYMFHMKADDTITLFIDNKQVGRAGGNVAKFTRMFNKGTYPFRVVYLQQTASKHMSIEVESISVNRKKLPSEWLSKSGNPQKFELDETKPGLDYVVYNEVDNLSVISEKSPDSSGTALNFKSILNLETNKHVVSFNGLLKLPKSGHYRLYLKADGIARVYINNILVLGHTASVGAGDDREIQFLSEISKIEVDYLPKGGKELLGLEIEGEGILRQSIPTEWFFRNGSENFIRQRSNVEVAPSQSSNTQKSPASSNVKDDEKDSQTGLSYKYYETSLKNNIVDILKQKIIGKGEVDTINFKRGQRDEYYGLYFYGYINLPESEDYTFYLSSDDQGLLRIDDKELIRHAYGDREGQATVTLSKGSHKLEIFYYQASGERQLSLNVKSKSIKKQKVPSSWYSRNLKAEKKASIAEGAYLLDGSLE